MAARKQKTLIRVVRVRYRFEKCKPWLIHYAPHLYPDLLKEANAKEADQVSDQFQCASISDATASSGRYSCYCTVTTATTAATVDTLVNLNHTAKAAVTGGAAIPVLAGLCVVLLTALSIKYDQQDD
ncbi:hypothetical protein TEA_024549 [Camellia sinensis var. sinensis]|uniref:Uncharacterized protein n=1 Tax=Camellia sinensis var. sinensis TaxID=542762 RepID=A0A4S4EP83_CAMSN|nr:hypothetical protein TEA_024549 [Camellia sinensis var. sinensis]